MRLISLVDERRPWFKAREGLDVRETGREFPFVPMRIAADSELIVTDAAQDPLRFRQISSNLLNNDLKFTKQNRQVHETEPVYLRLPPVPDDRPAQSVLSLAPDIAGCAGLCAGSVYKGVL